MSETTTTTPNMTELRTHLMATLSALRDRENPMEIDRARAVAQVATVLVDSAKVEVEFIKATAEDTSAFFNTGDKPALPAPSGYQHGSVQELPGGRRHTMGR
jgi:hypothetical protein